MMGLRRLGHDAYFIEDSDDYPSCYDPDRFETGVDPTYGLRFAESVFQRVGLGDRWAYYDAHQAAWHGPRCADATEICESADLVLNLSGVNPLRPWTSNSPARVLVDTDPAFTQIRHIEDPSARALADRHTAFLTFGENVGAPDCLIPDDGFPWQPTRQPVVLDAWPREAAPQEGGFSTVMQWESYPERRHAGVVFGMKSASFERVMELPSRIDARFELAIGSESAPRDLLRSKGWGVRDPLTVSLDPWVYQDFVTASRAEFTVAKQGYAVSRSGWFSERSAGYMACGRPVITQDTGFSTWLPTGKGVLAYTNFEEAVACCEDVAERYEEHCQAARELVETFFDSDRVLGELVAGLGLCAPNGSRECHDD